jgi:hypothetical protein
MAYIALGSMNRSSDEEIIAVLEKIQPLLDENYRVLDGRKYIGQPQSWPFPLCLSD